MVTDQIKRNLTDIYFVIRQVPGWLAWCKSADYTDSEIGFLEKMDDEYKNYNPASEIEKWEQEIDKEFDLDVWSASDNQEKLSVLTWKYSHWRRLYFMKCGRDINEAIRIDRKVSHIEHLMRMTKAKLNFRDTGRKNYLLSDDQIRKASFYPLERLLDEFGIEITKSNKIICPFHEDKHPSMWIKKGFGYCFSCQASVDSVGWLMRIEGYSFPDAVRRLIREDF